MLKMVDISNYNADVDLRSLDCDIMAIKATEGTGYTSPAFQHQWLRARELGKARIAYHYNHPSLSAAAQVRYFLDRVTEVGLEDEDCLALDHETSDGMAATAVSEQAVDFRDKIQNESKCHLIVYTYLSFAESGNCIGLGDNPLWIADPSRPPGHPRVPEPWKDWLFHQYGVVRGVDADLFNSDRLEDLYKLAVLPPEPPPAPDMREVEITDGHQIHSTFVHDSNFVAGFEIHAGDATFKILR